MAIRETDANLKIASRLVDLYQTPMFSNDSLLGAVSSGYNKLNDTEKLEYAENQTKSKNTIVLSETFLNDGLSELGGGVTDNYLTFTALQANSTVSMQAAGTAPAVSLEYSVDGGNTWSSFVVGSTTVTLTNIGDSVKLRGINSTMGSGVSDYNFFVITGSLEGSGSVTSIIDGVGNEIDAPGYCFFRLFYNSGSIGEKLVKAPDMPIRTVGNRALGYMYYNQALRTTPVLTASSVESYGYFGIFRGCIYVDYVKMLATSLKANSLSRWLDNVAASGTLVCDSSLTLEVGVSGLPDNWTRVDL